MIFMPPDDEEIKAKGYEITVSYGGQTVTVTLSQDRRRWMVKAKGYHGYFTNLESAWKEAIHHAKKKLE